MILRPNSNARMADALPNFGCVTLIMIAVMIPMNLLTCVVNEIVQQDGRDALDNRTIVAFLNGFSVMVKMIAEITAMNCQKIVQFVIPKLISNVPIIDAFQSEFKLI